MGGFEKPSWHCCVAWHSLLALQDLSQQIQFIGAALSTLDIYMQLNWATDVALLVDLKRNLIGPLPLYKHTKGVDWLEEVWLLW